MERGSARVDNKFAYKKKPYLGWIIKDIDVSPDVFQDGTSIYSDWAAPVDKPNDGKSYLWDEETLTWIEQ